MVEHDRVVEGSDCRVHEATALEWERGELLLCGGEDLLARAQRCRLLRSLGVHRPQSGGEAVNEGCEAQLVRPVGGGLEFEIGVLGPRCEEGECPAVADEGREGLVEGGSAGNVESVVVNLVQYEVYEIALAVAQLLPKERIVEPAERAKSRRRAYLGVVPTRGERGRLRRGT